jgi:hypothetical protein
MAAREGEAGLDDSGVFMIAVLPFVNVNDIT